MTLTFASFLAGSLLTMLLPILLLIVMASLLIRAIRRVPGGDASGARRATPAEHSAPAAAPLGSLNPPSGDPPVEEV